MEPVRIAVVGLNFGRHMVEQILAGAARPHLRLIGVCSQEPDLTAEVARQYGIVGYSSLDQVLADENVEAVGLFTGPEGRAGLVRGIVQAGKHVLTTKPFELDPFETQRVLHEARERNRVVHLNSPSPLLGADLEQINVWRERLHLGKPVACRADAWCSYREQADGKWYDDPQKCPVAPIFRLGIYLINDLVRLLGPAHSVQVMKSQLLTGRPTPDNAQLTILFRNDCIASLFASFCVKDAESYKNSLTFNFENGTIYRNVGPGTSSYTCQLSVVSAPSGIREIHAVQLPSLSGEYQWNAFQRAVRGQTLPDQISPEQISDGLKIIVAMQRAEQSGRTEPVSTA